MVLYERQDDHDEFEHPELIDHEGKTRDAQVIEGVGYPIACCVIGLTKKPVEEPKVEEERIVDKQEREKIRVSPHQLARYSEGFRNYDGGFEGKSEGFSSFDPNMPQGFTGYQGGFEVSSGFNGFGGHNGF